MHEEVAAVTVVPKIISASASENLMSRLTTAKQSKQAANGSQTARVMTARERIVEEERHRADRCRSIPPLIRLANS